MAKVLARIDEVQRRHPVLGFPIAVMYKFFDDQGNYLAAILTYYAFIAIFPLMLIASSVLGTILSGDPTLQRELLDSGLSQFPIIGDQLGRPGQLTGGASAIIVGGLVALYGASGVAQAGQNMMQTLWSVPRNSRPNPLRSRLHSLVLVLVFGIAFFCIAAIGVLGNRTQMLGAGLHTAVRLLINLASIVFTAGVFVLLFRMATAHHHSLREALPGALVVAVLWQVLQVAGTAYVRHVILKASDMNKTFALVLGLVAILYVASVVAVLGAQINVVRARRLYPRALLTPFTDNVTLTDGDRRAYAAYAKGQRYKGFEVIDVTFGGTNDQDALPSEPTPAGAEKPAISPGSRPDP